MRIGYSYWGFMSDVKIEGGSSVSSPDGNAAYSWALVYELQRRSHEVWRMQRDRDKEAWKLHGPDSCFGSFSTGKRTAAYVGMHDTGGAELPELDLLLLEWRFPVPGRNCSVVGDDHAPYPHPDLHRQRQLIEHYSKTNTRIVVWDLDHKLSMEDEKAVYAAAMIPFILETSTKPKTQYLKRIFVRPPFIVDDLLQHPTEEVCESRKLVYVGSRYERDVVITVWIGPTAKKFDGDVHFYGNWDKAIGLWPGIQFHPRIGMGDMHDAYRAAAAVPLLAKPSYLESGFLTPRIHEAILFGSLPIGLGSMTGIREHALLVAEDNRHMTELVSYLSQVSLKERDFLREEQAHRLRGTDAKHFVDVLESI